LRADHPATLRGACGLWPPEIRALAHLRPAVETGRSSFEDLYGHELWEHLRTDPDAAGAFALAQGAQARRVADAVSELYDWSSFGTVVDIGGGDGTLLAALLARHPSLRGVLLDLPHVVATAGQIMARVGVAERYEIVGGDPVVDVPHGDAYLLSHVLCRWNDDRATAILRTIRKRMHRESRVVLLEPGGTEPDVASFDLLLLALGGGRVRSAAELGDLLATAALAAAGVVPAAACLLVEAKPA
jgi:hypothetical protein